MNKKTKKILTLTLCIVLSITVYLYICIVVTPKHIEDKGGPLYYRGMGFYSEPENSLDIMMFGNSDVYSGFAPPVLFEQYGYTSYASGRPNQTMKNIVPLLKSSLKTQKPSLILLETDCFYAKQSAGPDSSSFLLSPFIYHSRWKEIKPRDFIKLPVRKHIADINKGFIPSDTVAIAKQKEHFMGKPDDKPKKIPSANEKQIHHFLEICRENKIPVMFVELPSPVSWSYKKHNGVKLLAEKYDIPFLDLNIPDENYKVNMKEDFRDNGNHLNIFGASKATAFLGKYIKTNYGHIEDKRNHKDYASWHKVIDNFLLLTDKACRSTKVCRPFLLSLLY